MGEKDAVACLRILLRNSHEATEETHGNLSQAVTRIYVLRLHLIHVRVRVWRESECQLRRTPKKLIQGFAERSVAGFKSVNSKICGGLLHFAALQLRGATTWNSFFVTTVCISE